MDVFCTPYKAVIKRMAEVGITKKESITDFISVFEENKDMYLQVINENYYTKLDKKHPVVSMENVSEDIAELERNGLVQNEVIDRYRKMFRIKEKALSNTTLELGDADE